MRFIISGQHLKLREAYRHIRACRKALQDAYRTSADVQAQLRAACHNLEQLRKKKYISHKMYRYSNRNMRKIWRKLASAGLRRKASSSQGTPHRLSPSPSPSTSHSFTPPPSPLPTPPGSPICRSIFPSVPVEDLCPLPKSYASPAFANPSYIVEPTTPGDYVDDPYACILILSFGNTEDNPGCEEANENMEIAKNPGSSIPLSSQRSLSLFSSSSASTYYSACSTLR